MHPLETALADTPYDVETTAAERFNRYRFVLLQDDEKIGIGTHFTGGNHITPWLELQPRIAFDPDNEQHRHLFDTVADMLAPGSHIMVHYLQDEQTANAITADVPPPATPLGFLLWQAGCRWYKDWYFTEGWMEGDQKLQGNLPVDEENREEREQEWREVLEQFVHGDSAYPACQTRAEQVLAGLPGD